MAPCTAHAVRWLVIERVTGGNYDSGRRPIASEARGIGALIQRGRRIGNDLSRLRALPGRERRVLLVACALLPVFCIGLRFLGLRHFRDGPGILFPTRAQPRCMASPTRVAAMVNIAGNRAVFPSTCLARALLIDWLLRRQGFPAELRIGVRLADGVLAAHAWVECEGAPVDASPDISQEYLAFAHPPSPSQFPPP